MNTAAVSIRLAHLRTEAPFVDGPQPAQSRSRATAGMAALAVAVALAAGVAFYLAFAGDSAGDSDEAAVPTPIPNLPGAPTPRVNTGVLDPNRPKEGEAAPNFALPDVRDPSRVRELKDFRGKVVVLNFWATWCGPCKQEMPEFERAQQALGEQVVVLGINYRESPEKAVAFLDDLETTFPSLVDGGGKVAEHYRVAGLPVTYFLDRDGVVRHIERGSVSVEELEKYLAEAGVAYSAAD